MDRGRYIDFDPSNDPNTVWNFIEQGDGSFRFDTYTLNHARLGDSDSIYCTIESLKCETVDEKVEAADSIVSFVNECYSNFAQFAFNCPPDRTKEIESNREIVADSVFVASKKRYAARVIDDEGERKTKLKIMGLEIKRSDTPEIVKDFLMRIIESILDGATETELKTIISRMREDYMEAPLGAIARPMSVKGLHGYYKKLEETGSTKGFPYQVRASMFYNSLCSANDQEIRPGDKIAIIYINDPRENYIAFPIDIDPPKFVKDLQVNYDAQWEKANKKIYSYLSAMGWDLKSKAANKRKELFGF